MVQHAELEFAAKTDTGLVRPHNEDSVAISAGSGLAILADGMGGYNAGEVASGIATAVLRESLEQRLRNPQWDKGFNRNRRIRRLVVECVLHTNASIIEAARLEPKYSGMGTTLVAALFHHDKVTIAHIGDSRAYRLRQGVILQITRDHSFLQEQIDAGLISLENSRFSQNRNLVTRAMGVDYDVEVEIHDHATEAGDIYLLCSDGLSDMLSSKEISDIMTSMGSDLDAGCDALVKKANNNGGRDNISVILVKVKSKTTETRGLFGRVSKRVK
jgi:serine/threonine protein phosphatase PrpC